ncbi:MAG: glycosyltransferase family 2 protein [Acidimicrobiales bacterium]
MGQGESSVGRGDPVDEKAAWNFDLRYDEPGFDPIVVLVPAYNEAGGIGAVLSAIPDKMCGELVTTLVVVDGATDTTAELAEAHGAYVCPVPVNRGQGAALRLGYRLATEHGARWIAVIDADGQYDPDDLPALVQALVDGDADLVLGSRRLGRAEVDDPVRYAGVLVFSTLVSAMLGCRITDSSSGIKAMTSAVASAVKLSEPQYQAAELLISAAGRGFRVAERPVTMSARRAGRSKKAHNFIYGCQYARVIVRTWLRER